MSPRRLLVTLLLGLCTSLCAWSPPAAAKTKVCPGPSTVPGIDVSYWQGTIDWAKVKASGKKYAIMRAAHALQADTKFAYNWKQCHAQGLHCGVYQYFEPNIDPIKQANLMLSMMGKLGPGDLPPVIDVESKAGQTPSQISAAVGKWIAHVEKATGRKPMIYTGAYFWEDYVKSTAFKAYPLWHAQYCTNCCANIAAPWTTWHFWQTSSTGKVAGIAGNVDLDLWNGSQAALDAFAVPVGCKVACQGTTLVSASCAKTDCAKQDSTCVVDSLGGRCVSKHCPAKGDKLVCVPSKDDALLGTCKDGKLTTSDCSKYAAFCSTAATGTAKCVSAFCAATPKDKPVAKDVCLPDGKRYACSAKGDLTAKPCASGSKCVMAAGAATCQATACTPKCSGTSLVGADCKATDCAPLPYGGTCVADAKGPRCISQHCKPAGNHLVCLPDPTLLAIGTCQDGKLTVDTCQAGEQLCVAKAPGGPICAHQACVSDPSQAPQVSTTCIGDGLLGCDAKGQASWQACPKGQVCAPGQPSLACALPVVADAGSADAGGTDTEAPDTGGGPTDAGDATADLAAADAGELDGAADAAETDTQDGAPDAGGAGDAAPDTEPADAADAGEPAPDAAIEDASAMPDAEPADAAPVGDAIADTGPDTAADVQAKDTAGDAKTDVKIDAKTDAKLSASDAVGDVGPVDAVDPAVADSGCQGAADRPGTHPGLLVLLAAGAAVLLRRRVRGSRA